MNKKILIGSIIAVSILLLMPSIPAIQLHTIKEKAYSDLVEAKDFDELFASIREKLTSIDEGGDIGVLGPGLGLILWILSIIWSLIDGLMNAIENVLEFGIIKIIVIFSLLILFIPFQFLWIILWTIFGGGNPEVIYPDVNWG